MSFFFFHIRRKSGCRMPQTGRPTDEPSSLKLGIFTQPILHLHTPAISFSRYFISRWELPVLSVAAFAGMSIINPASRPAQGQRPCTLPYSAGGCGTRTQQNAGGRGEVVGFILPVFEFPFFFPSFLFLLTFYNAWENVSYHCFFFSLDYCLRYPR